MSLVFKKMKSPVGELTLVARDRSLIAVLWENDRPGRVRLPSMRNQPGHPVLRKTEVQLREYFSGKRRQFDLPIEFRGTEFQVRIWRSLLKIGYGKTMSYSELARAIGAPRASRAVGAANGRNPLSIICPCHRVIGKTGLLTGFAGGLQAKEFLLALEHPRDPAL